MSKTAHAKLSGSAAHRWMRCPGSVRMIPQATGDGGPNPYAREGTFAHAIAAHILTTGDVPKADAPFTFMDHDEEITSLVTDEMLEHVMTYVEHVRSHRGILMIERHVDLSDLVRDEMWGTGDAIISKEFDELVVSDFKYGFYPVHLVDYDLLLDTTYGELSHINPQLLYYAAGAAHLFEWRHKKIILEVIQPRCMEVETVQSVTVDKNQLKRWAEEDLWKAAHLATSENAPLVAGDWCRFCPALAICPEARRNVQDLAAADFADLEPAAPEVPEDVVNVLRWAPIIDAWLRACEAHALELMRRGTKVPGFKLVEKRANRCWPTASNEEIFKMIHDAGGQGQLKDFLVTEFMSPAKAEKIAGKKPVNAVCLHPRGDITIAAESDRRPAVEPVSEFEEFAS